ncbi:MAG: iron-containing alcohol dehydrogenase [Bacteroidia bacterium]|nr:iron-containing alcohol dehydrogenase [Bacteroidia bacterium]HRG03399.1 iron-containing alcohol dehydrogenase [Paludibacteraceae bacterium]
MNNFSFYSPTYFEFGRNTEEKAGKLISRFGGKKVLIHYGSGSVVRSGLLGRVIASLDAEGIHHIELGGAVPNPRSGLVYEGIELCRKEKVDFILAVGGGSAIDSAKAIAIGVPYEGDFWDFYTGRKIEEALPVATILTLSAAGSEASASSVITHENGMVKRGTLSDKIRPVFSILNPELTTTLPPFQTAAGATDMFAHVLERYFTNTRDVEITDRLCEAVMLTIINEAPKAITNPADYEARANIMWAGMVAHNDICGVGRVQDWGSHQLEHELSALYDVAHGAGLAVMFPAWMKFTMKHDVMRFAQFAVRVFGCQMDFQQPERTAREGIERFESFLKAIGMPVRFKELGAKREDIPTLIQMLKMDKRGVGNFVKLSAEDVEAIYNLAADEN